MRPSSWKTSHKWARSALRLGTPGTRRSAGMHRNAPPPSQHRLAHAPTAASPPLWQVDEIFGTIQEVYFTVKPSEGVTAASFKVGSLARMLILTISPLR